MIRINKIAIKQYLLIYLLIIFQGSILFKNNQDMFYIGVLAFAMGYLFLHTRLLYSGYMRYVYVLALTLVLVSMQSGGSLSIASICNIISRFLLVYITYEYDRQHFTQRLIKCVVFLSVISLIGFIVQRTAPNILMTLLPSTINNGEKFFGMILFTYSSRLHKDRNIGIMAEPGLFQMIVNVAIYLLLFGKCNGSITGNKRIRYLLILVITVITIQSTTGYIGTAGLIVLYLLDKRRNQEDRRIKRMLVSFSIVLVVACAILGKENMIYENLVSKVTNQNGEFDLKAKSGKSRVVSMMADIEVMKNHPLGAGFQIYQQEWSSHQTIHIIDESSCVGITKCLATLGIPTTLLLMLFYTWYTYKNQKNPFGFVAYFFQLFNTCLGQPLFYFPILMIIVLCPMNKQRDSLKEGHKQTSHPMIIQYSK